MPEQKRLPKTGQYGLEIKQYLKAVKSFDLDPHSGRVGRDAYMKFLDINCLDFTVFPSTLRLETETVSMVGSLLHAPPTLAGNITTGGTESCFLAVKAAREFARKDRGIERPEIIVSHTTHACFHKAAHILDMKLISVKVNPQTFAADVEEIRKAITPNTIMVVASAVSYPRGIMDPIPQIAALAKAHDQLFHVDASIGGFVLSFFRKLGNPIPPFDFEVDGVTSISIDLHKYGFCPKNASCVLYRDKSLRRHQIFSEGDWYFIVNNTVLSSKTAGPVAAAYACMSYLGESGYLEIMDGLRKGTNTVIEAIRSMPELKVLGDPISSLVAFTSDTVSTFQLVDLMKARGWVIQSQLQYQDSPDNIHLTLMPGIDTHAPQFIRDLRECVQYSCDHPHPGLGESHKQKLALVTDGQPMTDERYQSLLAMIGLSPKELPEEMGQVNMILNQLPVHMREDLIARFVNDTLIETRLDLYVDCPTLTDIFIHDE
eukprot:gene3798-4194_t